MTLTNHPRLFPVEDYDPKPEWPCPHCGGMPIPHADGFVSIDPCLERELSDVALACCGHGQTDRAFIVLEPGCHPYTLLHQLTNPTVLRGPDALACFAALGVGPDADRYLRRR
jgi:hypothetical protein